MIERFPLKFVKWALICGVCAIPSVAWASHEFDPAGMGLGVLAFVLIYAAVNSSDAFLAFEARPFVRRSLMIGFGTRIGVSLLFPVGMMIDLAPGLIAIDLIKRTPIPAVSTLGTFLITLIQGCLINLLLVLYMSMVYALQRLVCTPPLPPENICGACGYDIRASRQFGRCPECGKPC